MDEMFAELCSLPVGQQICLITLATCVIVGRVLIQFARIITAEMQSQRRDALDALRLRIEVTTSLGRISSNSQ